MPTLSAWAGSPGEPAACQTANVCGLNTSFSCLAPDVKKMCCSAYGQTLCADPGFAVADAVPSSVVGCMVAILIVQSALHRLRPGRLRLLECLRSANLAGTHRRQSRDVPVGTRLILVQVSQKFRRRPRGVREDRRRRVVSCPRRCPSALDLWAGRCFADQSLEALSPAPDARSEEGPDGMVRRYRCEGG